MTFADEIRIFTYENFIKSNRDTTERGVTIRAGDVHEAMGLKGKIPFVCGALGTTKFLKQFNLQLLKRDGPTCGANVYFTFKTR